MSPDAVRWETRYLQALLDQPAVSTITLADGRPVAVEQVYVPRTLLHEVVEKKLDRESGRDAQDFERDGGRDREVIVKLPVELWPKLLDERVVLVEGPAGMGKSTLTKQLVRESYTHHHLIPIWIPFRPFVASGLSIAEYLDQYYVPWLGLSDLRIPYNASGTGPDRSVGLWCYDQWKSGLGVLIFDGLDEVFRHDERVTALRGLPITGTGSTRPATILTSRPLSQSLPLQMAKVEVQGLTPPEQIRFMEKYQASLRLTDKQIDHFTSEVKKREQGRLRELLTRPGHLIQILTTYSRTNTLLDTETAILDQLLQSRLSIVGRSQPSVVEDNAEKKRLVLASLALHLLVCRQGQRHTRAQLLALIQQVLREHATHHTPLFPLAQATALLNDLTRNSGLLTEVEPDLYEFETVIWLQHLTGTALANSKIIPTLKLTNTQVLDFLDKKAWDPEWEPVLKSWVGTTTNPFPLFTRLIDKSQDDLARHRLGTAGRCLFEVNSQGRGRPEYQTLSVQVPTEAFEVWRKVAEQGTEGLVETSLRQAWVATKVGHCRLMELLKHENWELRKAAMRELGTLGEGMSEVVLEALMGRLEVEDSFRRPYVVKALGKVGTVMPETVQKALVGRLKDDNLFARVEVGIALGRLGSAMPDVLQKFLVGRLEDQCEYVRHAAVKALGGMEQALLRRVEDQDEEVGRIALTTQVAALSEEAQLALVERLQDECWFVQHEAVQVLRKLGAAISMQQVLMKWLEHEDGNVRGAVIEVLGELGTGMPEWILQAVVARLEDKYRGVRKAAMAVLRRFGLALPEWTQLSLLKALDDEFWVIRKDAAEILVGLGATLATSVQQALVGWLKNEIVYLRCDAIEAFGRQVATLPVSMQQALVGMVEHWNSRVREEALKSLGELGTALPEWILNSVAARLEDENFFVRSEAVKVLGRLGPTLPEWIQQALIRRLEDEDRSVQEKASEALGGLGAGLRTSAQVALMGQLEHKDRDVRRAVVMALRLLGATLPEWIKQALVKELEDSLLIPQRAGETLERLMPILPTRALEVLVVRLKHTSSLVRRGAIQTIEGMEAVPSEWILQALVSRLQDEDKLVQNEAEEALAEVVSLAASVLQRIAVGLEHKDAAVQESVVNALERRGAMLSTLVQHALVRLLEDEDRNERQRAVEAVSGFGMTLPESVLHALVVRLEDRHVMVRSKAAEVLGSLQEKGLRLFSRSNMRSKLGPNLFQLLNIGVRLFNGLVVRDKEPFVSDLSATAPFLGDCCTTSQRSSRFSLY